MLMPGKEPPADASRRRCQQRLVLYGWSIAALAVLARSSGAWSAPRRLPRATDILATADVPLGADCCGAVSPGCPPIPPANHLLLFVSVPNAAADASRRHPLRAQWAKSLALMEQKARGRGAPRSPRTELRFVIGTEGMDAGALKAIRAESHTHRDVLLIDAPDKDAGEPRARSSTTLKVLHSMRYAVNHYTFDYFARVGDDAYFRVDYFAELAREHIFPAQEAYIGYKFSNHIVPATDSTHNFIVDMGFLLTYDLAQFTCAAHRHLHDGFPEDAVVGAWYVGTRARVLHEPRFHDIDHVTTVAYAPCTNTSLLMHHMWSQDKWDAIDEEGLLAC